MDTTRTEWIPSRKLGWLTDRVAKLNKRAERLGCQPIEIERTGSTRDMEERDDLTGVVLYRWTEHEVALTGGTPTLDGYTFTAVIEHTPTGNIITAPNLDEAPEQWRTVGPRCDHCRKTRSRKATIVVTDTDGNHVHVGKSCAKDFLGWHADPLAYAALLEEMRAPGEGAPNDTPEPDAAAVAGFAKLIIDAVGFQNARSDNPTKHTIEAFFGRSAAARREVESILAEASGRGLDIDSYIGDAADEILAEVRAWATDAGGDFGHNCRVVMSADEIPVGKFGLAAAAVWSTWRDLEAEAERRLKAEAAAAAKAQAADAPEGRATVTGTIAWIRAYESDFGVSVKMMVVADDGWECFGTLPAALDRAEPGDRVEFCATFHPDTADTKFARFKRPAKAALVPATAGERAS